MHINLCHLVWNDGAMSSSRWATQSGDTRRHYKKDSRFVYDLYTLTFDENDTLDSLDEAVSKPTFISTYSKIYS